MRIEQTLCAAAVGGFLLAYAGSALAQTAAPLAIDPAARPVAERDLSRAMTDLKRPVRAEMDVENAETVLANGAEARGAQPQPSEPPFSQMVAARQALLQRQGVQREEAAIDTAQGAAGN